MNALEKIFTALLFILVPLATHSQCNGLITDVPIFDFEDNEYNLLVTGAVNNDLSDLSQGICSINIEFFHNAVSDLVFQLTSPSGQTVTLIGDISTTGNITTNADWDLDFVPCSTEADPDFGIDSTWDNSSAWTNLGGYTGSYYPKNGCLEDFNLGSVNGSWKLRILDGVQFNEGGLLNFSITFCDTEGIGCFECESEAGTLTNNVLVKCTNEELSFDFQVTGQNTNSEYAYVYLVSQNGTLIDIKTDSIMTGLPAGTYQVCGVSILLTELPAFLSTTLSYSEIISMVANQTLGFCIDISDICTTIEIEQAPAMIFIDEKICAGEEYRIGDSILVTDGSYAVTINSLSNCDTNYLVNLEVVDIQPIIVPTSSNFTCSVTDITLDASQSIQEGFSDFLWSTSDGLLSDIVNGISVVIKYPGTYSLTQEENGCSFTSDIMIGLDNMIPYFSINSVPITCSSPSVEITVSSSVNIGNAIWNGPNGFSSTQIQPFVSIPGDYFVSYTDVNGCRFNGRHTVIQDINVPGINLFSERLSCEKGNVIIEFMSDSLFSSYSWTGPDGFTSDVESPTVTAAGSYSISAISIGGCVVQKSIEVFGDLQTFNYQVSGNTLLCVGGATLIEANTGIPGAFYIWSGPGNFSSTVSSPSVSAEGTYYVDIIANGCVVSDSVLVDRDISELPEYDVRIDTLGDCENPLFRFTAIPIANEQQVSRFRWGITGVSVIGEGPQVETNSVGNFFLVINTFNGCTVVERFTLAPLPPDAPMVIPLPKTNVTCATGMNSGILQVEYDPNLSYHWEGPNGFTADTSRIENLSDGFYNLTVENINTGCKSFHSDRILADTLPRTSNVSTTEINCNNATSSVVLRSNGGGNTYFWQGPTESFTTPSYTTMQAGQYFLTITGGNGCVTLDTANVISDFSIPNINLIDTTLDCTIGAAPLTSITSDPGLIYSWQGPDDYVANAATPTVFNPGLYMLTVTGLNGCSKVDTLQVSNNPDIPQPNLNSSGVLNCIDTIVTLFGDTDIVGPSFLWEGPNGFLSTLQNPTISEPGVYYYRVEDAMTCVGRDSFIVDEFIVLPESSFTLDSITCTAPFAELIADSPDNGAIFSWSGPNAFSSNSNIALAIDTGIYILTIRGSNNCVAYDTIPILANTEDLTTSYAISCRNPNLILDLLSDANNYNISWIGPNGFISGEFRPALIEAGTYNGSILGDNGCLANIEVQVIMDTIPPEAITSAIGFIKCEMRSMTLSGEGSSSGTQYEYFWTTGDGNIVSDDSQLNINIGDIGEYLLTVTDSTNGCIDTSIQIINEQPSDLSAIGIEIINPLCAGDKNGEVSILSVEGGSSPYSYSLDSFFFQEASFFSGLSAGGYNIFVKDSFGCVINSELFIDDPESITLELGDNIDVFLGDEVTISANTNLSTEQIQSIIWQIEDQVGCADCLSFNLSPNQDLTIELTLMDEFGCIIKDQVNVRVDQEPVLYKPNIFSPNEDGINDVFFLSSNAGVAQIRSIFIFDRWGNKVFENSNFLPGDPAAGWDGTISGSKLNSGTYVYKAEVEMITGLIRSVRGEVTLFR